nr:DNA translocase FtsK [Heyndrickxia acidiproducens]
MNVNWFKKISNLFKEEDEQEEKKIEHTDQPSFPASNKMDARVSYQYPKANFRFPAIPDRAEPVRPKHTPPVKKHESTPAPKKPEQPETPYPSGKVGQKGSQPFRPTHIPSPIYGFRRPEPGPPPEEEAVLEYELSDDYQHDIQLLNLEAASSLEISSAESAAETLEPEKQARPQPPIEADPVFCEKTPPAAIEIDSISDEGAIAETVAESDGKTAPATAEAASESAGETAPAEFETEADSEGKAAAPDAPETASESAEETALAESETEAELDGKAAPATAEAAPELTGETAPAESDTETETEGKTTPAIAEAASESGEKAQAGSETETETDGGTVTASESAEGTAPAASGTESVRTGETGQTPAAANRTREQAPKRERKHLPFNVLMLKQDRRKLAAKPREMNPAQQTEAQTGRTAEKSGQVNKEEAPVQRPDYSFPPLALLEPPVKQAHDADWINEQSETLNRALENFNVRAKVVNVSQGPSVTRFEVQPEPGVKVNKITNLNDDLKLSLAAKDIRIEAPIPGKHTVGIEIPNVKSRPVRLSEIIGDAAFQNRPSPLTVAMGLDISGKPIVTDLQKMPHGLIAGATGSGKSVCINSILISLLYKATPQELKLLMIDPKMVELAPYHDIPHLVSPVITDVKMATAALKWAVEEMDRRYELFAHERVRDIHRFNELAEASRSFADKLPYIVIVIDELADLMMTSPADVEDAICRIAQKARACGIHLMIATQRPSVDVITGLIKANIPTRIAFSVSSQVDSRTIIDTGGAEKLLGKGDMLFLENGSSKPVRLQGTFVTDQEIDEIVSHARQTAEPSYLFEPEELVKHAQMNEEEDELFFDACAFVIEQGGASTSLLQRNFRIGYNRAARLVDMMEQQGIVSEAKGSKPRDILMSKNEFQKLQETGTTIN